MAEIIDPRQIRMLEAYKNPLSPTFANMYRSALATGFPESYARSLSGQRPAWLTENIANDVELIQVSEKNLRKYISMNIDIGNPKNIDWARLQVDVSKYILNTLASSKYTTDAAKSSPQVNIQIVNYHKDKAPDAVSPSAVPDAPMQDATVVSPIDK